MSGRVLRVGTAWGVAMACAALAAVFAGRGAERAESAATMGAMKTTSCAGTAVATTFMLPSAAELQARHRAQPSQVWLDLSILGDDFAPGTYVSHGPHVASARVSQFDWSGMLPGFTHYYRVNGLFPNGWQRIAGGEFQTPDCVLITSYDCALDTGYVNVEFNLAAAPGAVEQWIDLSWKPLSYRHAAFINAGPFPPSGARFVWQGIVPLRTHHFRFNARYGNGGWVQQGAGTFYTPECRFLPAA